MKEGATAVEESLISIQRPLLRKRSKAACSLLLLLLAHASIWGLVGLNYVLNWVMRRQPLSHGGILMDRAILIVGHGLLALTIICYARVLLAPTLPVPKDWSRQAACGMTAIASCQPDGTLVPPRARVLRNGKMVLGFDHHCGWLGVPIGLHNRKFFVLFLLYAAALCMLGAVLSLYNDPHFEGVVEQVESDDFALISTGSSMVYVSPLSHALSFLGLSGVHQYTAVVDAIVASLLICFGLFHVHLVLRNVTTIDRSRAWDMGPSMNWRQIFGERAALWMLPLWDGFAEWRPHRSSGIWPRWRGAGGPPLDGVHWPTLRTRRVRFELLPEVLGASESDNYIRRTPYDRGLPVNRP